MTLHYEFVGVVGYGTDEVVYEDYNHELTIDDLREFFGDDDSVWDIDDENFLDWLHEKYYYTALKGI